jgi:hypothetical protein
MSASSEAAPQLTLVALHGSRPAALDALIDGCVADIVALAGASFSPYSARQLHATVLGLETVRVDGRRIQQNLVEHHGERQALRLDGFADYLLRDWAGFQVRFGGFVAGAVPFRSRGEAPYERSFSIQRDARGDRAVLIGWPEEPGPPQHFPDSLDALRRAARAHGIAHAYHRKAGDRDNDLYLRLGLFRASLADDVRRAIESRVRERLARTPVRVALRGADLRLVAYRSPELPPETTRAWPLAGLDLSDAGIEALLAAV